MCPSHLCHQCQNAAIHRLALEQMQVLTAPLACTECAACPQSDADALSAQHICNALPHLPSACSPLDRLLALHKHTPSRQPQPPPHPRSPVGSSANSALWAAIQNRPRQGSSTGLLVIRLRRSHAASWAPVWGCSMWMAPSVLATARACKAEHVRSSSSFVSLVGLSSCPGLQHVDGALCADHCQGLQGLCMSDRAAICSCVSVVGLGACLQLQHVDGVLCTTARACTDQPHRVLQQFAALCVLLGGSRPGKTVQLDGTARVRLP